MDVTIKYYLSDSSPGLVCKEQDSMSGEDLDSGDDCLTSLKRLSHELLRPAYNSMEFLP